MFPIHPLLQKNTGTGQPRPISSATGCRRRLQTIRNLPGSPAMLLSGLKCSSGWLAEVEGLKKFQPGLLFWGGTPIAGWFISWKILLKWMIWGYQCTASGLLSWRAGTMPARRSARSSMLLPRSSSGMSLRRFFWEHRIQAKQPTSRLWWAECVESIAWPLKTSCRRSPQWRSSGSSLLVCRTWSGGRDRGGARGGWSVQQVQDPRADSYVCKWGKNLQIATNDRETAVLNHQNCRK